MAVTCTSAASGRWSNDATWHVTHTTAGPCTHIWRSSFVNDYDNTRTGIVDATGAANWVEDSLVDHKILVDTVWLTIISNTTSQATVTVTGYLPGDGTYDFVLGGTPLDGDAVVINAVGTTGHEVLFDVNQGETGLNFTTGINGITITGTASGTTPAKLYVDDSLADNSTYYLVIKSGATIQGTNTNIYGKLWVGTSCGAETSAPTTSTPLAYTRKFFVDILTTGATIGITCNYLNIKIIGVEPTNRVIRLREATLANATSMPVDTDVTADKWAVGDYVAVVNVAGTSSVDYERRTIEGISSNTITLAAAYESAAGLTKAKIAGARVVLISRNVNFLYKGTQCVFGSTKQGSIAQCCMQH